MSNRAIIAKLSSLHLRTNLRNVFLMIICEYFDEMGHNMAKNTRKLTKIDQNLPKFGVKWLFLAHFGPKT